MTLGFAYSLYSSYHLEQAILVVLLRHTLEQLLVAPRSHDVLMVYNQS